VFPRILNLSISHSFFLFGSRGTGKSTLISERFKAVNPFVIDLLKRDLFRELQANPEKLTDLIGPFQGSGRIIVIDEVQKIPELLDLVHYHIERDKFIFALTGSSSRKLKRGGANLLAGRAFVFNLFPLHVLEYCGAINTDHALRWGTLPKVFSCTSDQERALYLRSYAETYLTEEIVEEQIVRNIPPFSRFLSVSAQCNGQIINYSKIARDIDSDSSNVRNYFSILDETMIGFFLPAFHLSIRKRFRASPKFYFYDTGVVRTLSKLIDLPLRPESKEYGFYFEAFVVNQIKSYLEYKQKQFQLSYIRSGDNAEVDLVIERAGEKTLLIEIKSGKQVDPSALNNLKRFCADLPNSRAICLYQGEHRRVVNTVEVLPWKEFFAEV
jgi:uncharacterized protein